MNTYVFSASNMIRAAWGTFEKRPVFLMTATGITLALLWISNSLFSTLKHAGPSQVIGFFVMMAAWMIVDMGFTAFFIRAHDDLQNTKLKDLWHPKPFWKFSFAAVVSVFLTIGGFVFVLVPGLILMTLFAFVKIIVIDQNTGPLSAIEKSANISKGNRFELFLLVISLCVMNFAGLLLFGIGLLVAMPVSILALIHAYRTLLLHHANTPVAQP